MIKVLRPRITTQFLAVFGSLFCYICFDLSHRTRLVNLPHTNYGVIQSRGFTMLVFNDGEAANNVEQVSLIRQLYSEKCNNSNPEFANKEPIVESFRGSFTIPAAFNITDNLLRGTHRHSAGTTPTTPADAEHIKNMLQPCQFTFIDLGANIGDSLIKFIDSGLPQCFISKEASWSPSFDDIIKNNDNRVFEIKNKSKNNKLIKWVRDVMDQSSMQISRKLNPEEYCYYGVEGNPMFTNALKQLEYQIMNTVPRPIRHVHFMTQTIASNVNGRSQLYLDTINTERNYWGSSIFSTHVDVQRSINNNNNNDKDTNVAAIAAAAVDVASITLSSLLTKVVRPISGAHIIIKCDIEGAEYQLINEAYDTGVLCNYLSNAIRIDILLELHPQKMVGTDVGHDRFYKEVLHGLRECGVNIIYGRDAG